MSDNPTDLTPDEKTLLRYCELMNRPPVITGLYTHSHDARIGLCEKGLLRTEWFGDSLTPAGREAVKKLMEE